MLEALSSVSSAVRGPGATSATSSVGSTSSIAPTSSVGSTDFASVMADVASNAVDAVRGGEATAISGIQGKASVQNVVEAILNAEQTLQTALAVRDKVVAAYQEISRMSI
jgi:flagellar hook-basal body complex protein FliE